jgi:hypothetical protein
VGDQGAVHWDGGSWKTVPTGAKTVSDIWGAGPKDVWAAALAADLTGTILHWDGSEWSTSLSGDATMRVSRIAGSATDDVWASGTQAVNGYYSPSLFHWDGGAWKRSTLGKYGISGVWSRAKNDAWASTGEGVIFHWDGVAWMPWGDPVSKSGCCTGSAGSAVSIWGTSAGDVWATINNGSTGVTSAGDVVQLNGGSWNHAATGSGGALYRGFTIGSDEWVVGGGGMALVRSSPIPAPAGGADGGADGGAEAGAGIKQVAKGYDMECDLRADSTISCNFGPPPPSGTFKSISILGGSSTVPDSPCAIATDNSIACWGGNAKGVSPPPSGTFVQVSVGSEHACAVRATDGSLVCWGSNGQGESTPPAGAFTEVTAGENHSCAIRLDGTVVCWGIIAAPPSGAFAHLTSGAAHVCGQRPDQSVTCWGGNAYGETDAPSGPFLQIDAGWYSTCGLRPNGKVVCWGNWYGNRLWVAPAGTFTQISQAYEGGCGVLTNGNVSCWYGTSAITGG